MPRDSKEARGPSTGLDDAGLYARRARLRLLSEDFVQRQIDAGLGARAWWYLHGLWSLMPELRGRLHFRWIFAEQKKPHEVLVRSPDTPHLYIGERQAITAALRFKKCLAENRWPGFPRHLATAQVRPWAARDWRAREAFSPDLADVALDLAKTLSPFNTEAAGLPDDDEEIRVSEPSALSDDEEELDV